MSGFAEYKVKIDAEVSAAKKEILELKNRITELEKGDHKVSINLDTKLLESALSKLDNMLSALSKNTGNFSQFENMAASIGTAVNSLKEMRDALVTIDNNGNVGNRISSSIDTLNTSLTTLVGNLRDANNLEDQLGNTNTGNSNAGNSNTGNSSANKSRSKSNNNNNLGKDATAYKDYNKELISLYKRRKQLETDQETGYNTPYHQNRLSEIAKEASEIEARMKELSVSEDLIKKQEDLYNREKALADKRKASKIDTYNQKKAREEQKQSDKDISPEYKNNINELLRLEDQRYKLREKINTGQDTVKNQTLLKQTEAEIQAIEKENELLQVSAELREKQEAKVQKKRANNEELLKQVTDNYNESVVASQIDTRNQTIENAIEKSNNAFQKIKLPESFSSEVSNLKTQLDALNTAFQSESENLTGDAFDKRLQKYQSDVESLTNKLSNLQKLSKKGTLVNLADNKLGITGTETNVDEMISNVTSELSKNYDILSTSNKRDMSSGIEQMVFKLRDAEGEISQLALNWDSATGKIVQSTSKLGNEGSKVEQFFTGLKSRFKNMSQYWMANLLNPYQIIGSVKSMIGKVVELDDALIDLKKTTTMSDSELNQFYTNSSKNAKEMGTSTKDLIQQAADWSRLGYSSNYEATNMAKKSSMFAAISPGMSTDEASSGLISIMKAYDISVDQVQSQVMDKINTLGNNFAETNADIVTGLQKSAAALSATGTSLDDAMALFTGGYEILQDAESMGTALRTISMRVRGKIAAASIYRNIYAVHLIKVQMITI